MKNNKAAGSLWKQLRLKAGLTQNEVAKELGYLNGQFISNVESGRCRFPGNQLPKIRSIYRLSASDIINIVLSEEEAAIRKVLDRTPRNKR